MTAVHRLHANLHACDMPSAALYDALYAPLLEGLYARVAARLAATHPSGPLLELSCGPGRLAARLARQAPDLRVAGLDVLPDMVAQARRHAARAARAARLDFVVGDAGALPFADASFAAVVSTLSLHHWPDPAGALAETYRVLRPGGVAWIYDGRWPPLFHHERTVARLADASPFGGGELSVLRWPGPLPLLICLELRRAA